MLLEFIKENRAELIRLTREKVKSRSAPRPTSEELETGVPLFLKQFTELLAATNEKGPPSAAIGTSATAHGQDLLKRGFTIAQVVHDYGDICQAVTELAGDLGATLSIVEFQTLNRCLDNAIAGAVTSWSQGRERDLKAEADEGK